MKNWRIALFTIIFLAVSLSCSLLSSGGTTSNQGTPETGVSGLVAKPSGLIDKVTMAKDTQGSTMDPVNPTTVFAASDTFHAVVHLNGAPANTQLKAIWYVVSAGSASNTNKDIDSSDYTAEGTGNVDFYLTPSQDWPAGTYQVEIYTNGVLDQVVNFSVK